MPEVTQVTARGQIKQFLGASWALRKRECATGWEGVVGSTISGIQLDWRAHHVFTQPSRTEHVSAYGTTPTLLSRSPPHRAQGPGLHLLSGHTFLCNFLKSFLPLPTSCLKSMVEQDEEINEQRVLSCHSPGCHAVRTISSMKAGYAESN